MEHFKNFENNQKIIYFSEKKFYPEWPYGPLGIFFAWPFFLIVLIVIFFSFMIYKLGFLKKTAIILSEDGFESFISKSHKNLGKISWKFVDYISFDKIEDNSVFVLHITISVEDLPETYKKDKIFSKEDSHNYRNLELNGRLSHLKIKKEELQELFKFYLENYSKKPKSNNNLKFGMYD